MQSFSPDSGNVAEYENADSSQYLNKLGTSRYETVAVFLSLPDTDGVRDKWSMFSSGGSILCRSSSSVRSWTSVMSFGSPEIRTVSGVGLGVTVASLDISTARLSGSIRRYGNSVRRKDATLGTRAMETSSGVVRGIYNVGVSLL